MKKMIAAFSLSLAFALLAYFDIFSPRGSSSGPIPVNSISEVILYTVIGGLIFWGLFTGIIKSGVKSKETDTLQRNVSWDRKKSAEIINEENTQEKTREK